MPTESVPLQPLEQNGEEDERNTDPGYLQKPPTELGTKSSRKVRYWKDWPWKRILNTVVSLLGYISLYSGISMIAPFYPILAARHGVATYIVGFVVATAALCMSVVSPFIGYFLPHLGLKFTQLAGLFLAGGSFILFGFVSKMPTPATFITFSFLLRITEGIGTAMFSTATYTLLTQLHPKNKGTVVGGMEFSMAFGSAIGAPIGGGLQEVGGFKLPFIVVGSCIIVLMLILVGLVQSTECTSKIMSWRLSVRLLTNIMVVLLVLTLIVAMSTGSATLSYLGRFLNSQFNLRVGIIGVVYFSGSLLYALSTFIAGPLTDRLVPRYLIIFGLMVGSAASVLIGPAEFITTPKLWLTILAFTLLGAAIPFAVVPVYLDVYNIATHGHTAEDEEAIASTLSGIIVAGFSVGGVIGPIVGGALVYKIGFQSMTSILSLPFLTTAVVLIISTVIYNCCKRPNISTVIHKCCKGGNHKDQ